MGVIRVKAVSGDRVQPGVACRREASFIALGKAICNLPPLRIRSSAAYARK